VPVGIRAFSAFIPWYRVSRQVIESARSPSGAASGAKGARAAASSDEDALTLAVEAAGPLAEHHRAAGGALSSVLFASTSAPYAEKSCASLLAGACDVPFERLRTTDLAGTARAGLQAMLCGFERMLADRESADALVAAADVRTPPPGSDHEGGPGDAAGALLLGRGSLVAELLGTHSVAGDPFVQSGDTSLTQTAGFVPITRAAIAGALTNANIQIADVAHFAIGGPSTSAALALLEKAGADASRLAPLFDDVLGNTGAAQPLLSFAAALEASKPGDVVVLAAWGDGADALVFRTLATSPRAARPLSALLQNKRDVGYARYLEMRGLAGSDATSSAAAPDVPPPGQSLRLRGAKCRYCGAIGFPMQPVCAACGKEGTDSVRLSRRGTLSSFTRDAVTVTSVVDLDGGGRVSLPLTDADPETVAIGTPVELTLRYFHTFAGFRQYVWKARPVRA
jgi:hydroxymethylglutaryl-CoA synthase